MKKIDIKLCANCKYYSFKEYSMQECLNINNYQLNDDNELSEERWYTMMVTPDFGCNQWEPEK